MDSVANTDLLVDIPVRWLYPQCREVTTGMGIRPNTVCMTFFMTLLC